MPFDISLGNLLFSATVSIIITIILIIIGIQSCMEEIRLRAHRRFKRIRDKLSGETTLVDRAICYAVSAQLDCVNSHAAANAIARSTALTTHYSKHYAFRDIHMERRLKVEPLMNGSFPEFFDRSCEAIGNAIGNEEIDFVVFPHKNSNQLLASKVRRNKKFAPRAQIIPVSYNEQQSPPRNVNCRELVSFQHAQVVVVDTLTCNSEPLVSVLQYVKDQGGIVRGVGVLFDALYPLRALTEVIGLDVAKAFHVDLKPQWEGNCNLCDDKRKYIRLKYDQL